MRATAQDPDAVAADGHQRQPHDRVHVRPRRRHGRRGGVLSAQFTTTTRYDAGFQLGLIAFTAAVLGGIGNLLGAVLGGVLIGLIQALNDGAPALPRRGVVADRRVLDPDPDPGLPARGPPRQDHAGEGLDGGRRAAGSRARAAARAAARPRRRAGHIGGSPTVRWGVFVVALAVAIAFPWIRDCAAELGLLAAADDGADHRRLRAARARPQHRRRLRRPARPRLRGLLPSAPTPRAGSMSGVLRRARASTSCPRRRRRRSRASTSTSGSW